MGVQTPANEKIKKLLEWKNHPEWSSNAAARDLNVKKPTLLSWKKKYWAVLESPPDVGDGFRAKGGGRKHKMASFEWGAVDFYDAYLQNAGVVTTEDMFSYCSKYPAGSAFFSEIAFAYEKRKPEERNLENITGECDWGSYPYVLLPVCLNNHWSLLGIESPIPYGQSSFYHVNSLRGGHNPEDLFAILEWFLSFVNKALSDGEGLSNTPAYNYITKPRQSNPVDCGVYMLHYMHAVYKRIVNHRPDSLLEHMPKLTSGTFNTTKAAASRAAFRNAMMKIDL